MEPEDLKLAFQQAEQGVSNMSRSGAVKTAANVAVKASPALGVVDSFNTDYLQPLKIFATVVNELGNVSAFLGVPVNSRSHGSLSFIPI